MVTFRGFDDCLTVKYPLIDPIQRNLREQIVNSPDSKTNIEKGNQHFYIFLFRFCVIKPCRTRPNKTPKGVPTNENPPRPLRLFWSLSSDFTPLEFLFTVRSGQEDL